MRPLVRPWTDPVGGQWFVTSGLFPTETLGAAAYKWVMAKTERGDLGVYRHDEPPHTGRYVSAVSLGKRSEVLRVSRLLAQRGAVDADLHPALVEQLCIRRARVVADALQRNAPAGRYKIKHALPGARMNPDGSMTEPVHGEG